MKVVIGVAFICIFVIFILSLIQLVRFNWKQKEIEEKERNLRSRELLYSDKEYNLINSPLYKSLLMEEERLKKLKEIRMKEALKKFYAEEIDTIGVTTPVEDSSDQDVKF